MNLLNEPTLTPRAQRYIQFKRLFKRIFQALGGEHCVGSNKTFFKQYSRSLFFIALVGIVIGSLLIYCTLGNSYVMVGVVVGDDMGDVVGVVVGVVVGDASIKQLFYNVFRK